MTRDSSAGANLTSRAQPKLVSMSAHRVLALSCGASCRRKRLQKRNDHEQHDKGRISFLRLQAVPAAEAPSRRSLYVPVCLVVLLTMLVYCDTGILTSVNPSLVGSCLPVCMVADEQAIAGTCAWLSGCPAQLPVIGPRTPAIIAL